MAHKGARNDLSAEYVRNLLDYDPNTGVLTWQKVHPKHFYRLGKPAGWQRPDGRVMVSFNEDGQKREYRAHRVIWLMMTGEWPLEEIDHIDLDPSNNRWANLRLASSSQNMSHRGLQSNNKSGHPGVFFNTKTKRWWAYIKQNGQRQHLGVFDNFEDALAARTVREKELFGRFAPP